jgi:hypothetical protein
MVLARSDDGLCLTSAGTGPNPANPPRTVLGALTLANRCFGPTLARPRPFQARSCWSSPPAPSCAFTAIKSSSRRGGARRRRRRRCESGAVGGRSEAMAKRVRSASPRR